ncbi:MAG: hypothetical protein E4H17_01185 [Gemmatimonadales bacterium]|nr:MAG: hypothetical protein E4H17_01185 [Gemmatimonadales bacterium]
MFRRTVERIEVVQVAADEPVRIDDLISPLRYDVLIRQRFLSLLAESPEMLVGDLSPLLELPPSRDYFAWFQSVVVPRFMPGLVGRPEEISAAFEVRVRASIDLLRSVERSGFDSNNPIMLRTGKRIEATATGKRLARGIYIGDGCHRTALLRARGVTVLEPGSYRLERERRFQPLDNTTILLRAQPIGAVAYWGFMALSYGALVAADRSGPAAGAASADPERFAEMTAIASLDTPLLRK